MRLRIGVPQRLWWRIWLAVITSIALFALLSATAWRVFFDPARIAANAEALAAIVAAALPPADAPADEQMRFLVSWQRRAQADFALFDAQRNRIASAGRPLPPPRAQLDDSHWLARRRFDPAAAGGGDGKHERAAFVPFALRLADDRWLVVRRDWRPARPPFGLAATLIAIAVGIGTYPVVRRLTRRLERLQASVERLGAGDLKARVAVEGRDEVARLAASFNNAAARVELLVVAQQSLLANASHELRSPLARVRLAVEMLKQDARPELKHELERDIAEIDSLIDEILLASRLDATNHEPALEDVDLTALAAEECARADARLDAQRVAVRGDARLLRRLLRNLLENARRHGGAAVDVSLSCDDESALLAVCDRGPGVPDSERERIFEPFYRLPGATEAAGGAGLGLALVRKIITQHGGSVSCKPRANGGSCFEVVIPTGAAPPSHSL